MGGAPIRKQDGNVNPPRRPPQTRHLPNQALASNPLKSVGGRTGAAFLFLKYF